MSDGGLRRHRDAGDLFDATLKLDLENPGDVGWHVEAHRPARDDVYTAVLAIGAFLALNRWHGKLTVLYVVLGCGVLGVLLQAAVV